MCVEGKRLEEVSHPKHIRGDSHRVFFTGIACLCGTLLWAGGVRL